MQLISVSSSYSLGENCLSICAQWDEDLIAKQDSDIITLKYSSDVTLTRRINTNRCTA